MNEILVAQAFCTFTVYFMVIVVVVGISLFLIAEYK
jgi:hypothetical protein